MAGESGIVCSRCGADNDRARTTCAGCGHLLPPATIEPGFVLASRYEVHEPLGAGGMGVVYKARDRLLDETVAIKVLRPDAAQAPETAARFISELKLARAISHRNVARIHEYGVDQGIRYISMAFVDGVDLKRLVRERGPLPAGQALDVATQVAEGLHAIHEEGIVHRDLKSSNIMIDGRGVVRVMDFGVAKLWSPERPQDMTASGQIVGTPEYMSPEQILGRPIDRRSDIYSLGVIVYELLTGRTPLRGDTPIATLMMHLNDPPPLEGPAAGLLPAPVRTLLRKALDKQPGERFATALDFARALAEARVAVPIDTNGASAGHPPHREGPATASADRSLPTLTLTPTAIPSVAGGGPTAVVRPGRPSALVWTLALAATAIGGWLAFGRARPAPAAAPAPSTTPATTRESAPPSLPASSAPTAATELAPTGPAATPHPVREPPPPRRDRSAAVKPEAPVAAPGSASTLAANPPPSEPLASRIDTMLADAGAALEAQRYDDAIVLYDRVLERDPRQQMALIGRATAVSAKNAARAVEARADERGRSLVAEGTSATAANAGPDRAYSQSFEDGAGLDVRNDTGAARPPGRIEFETRPETLRAGEHYTLRVYFANPAKAPVEIGEMIVTNTVNGRKSSGPVAPSTRTVAPEQKALLLSLSDFLAEGTDTWSLEVRVRTGAGETYRNRVSWK